MWQLDCEESWVPKNWCFWTVVLEKTLESPLDCKEIQPVHSKGDQPWVFFGRNDAEAETPVLWPPHAKSWLIGKDSDAGRDWGREEKGTMEDEIAEWYHWLDGRESKWTPEVGDGQGGLACCDSWGRKESDMTERLNWIVQLQLICLADLWQWTLALANVLLIVCLCEEGKNTIQIMSNYLGIWLITSSSLFLNCDKFSKHFLLVKLRRINNFFHFGFTCTYSLFPWLNTCIIKMSPMYVNE